MAIETDEDRLELLTALGDDVTLNPNGSAVIIRGIYDAGHVLTDTGQVVDVSDSEPMLTVRTKDVTTVVQGSEIDVNSTTYKVVDIQPDGTGITILRLHTA